MAGEMTIFSPNHDDRDARIAELQAENKRLRAEVAAARADAEQAHRDTSRALSALRSQLAPLHRALQMVFGELDAVGVEETTHSATGTGTPNARVSQVWESWKSRLGPSCAKVIDALLLHGEMNTQQLAIAAGYSRQNITNLIVKINRAGLINKNGGKFSLKPL